VAGVDAAAPEQLPDSLSFGLGLGIPHPLEECRHVGRLADGVEQIIGQWFGIRHDAMFLARYDGKSLCCNGLWITKTGRQQQARAAVVRVLGTRCRGG